MPLKGTLGQQTEMAAVMAQIRQDTENQRHELKKL
jgi:hypothetical protein